MSVYTHDFEIMIDGISIEGEIKFGKNPHESLFTTHSGETMTIAQHGHVQKLLESLIDFCGCCGQIDKIEVTKKVEAEPLHIRKQQKRK